jgi:RNA polymerase sigma-70 factor (ECF subfamily)
MNWEPIDDIKLIAMIIEGRTEALEELYNRYNRLVFSVALAIVGERGASEEVTLDVFMRVWRRAKTYQSERGKVSTWLIAITRHHAIDVIRWQNSRSDSKNISLDDISQYCDRLSADPQESAEMAWLRMEIHQAFKRLPNEQRQVIVLAYFKGYSQSQIADLLAQPLGTIKTRIRLGMQKLRQLLAGEEQSLDKSEDVRSAYPIDRKE